MNDWKVVTLADCASFQEGYVNPSKNEPSYFGGTIKWLRATDLNNGFVYKTSQTLTEKGFLSAKKSAVLFEPDSLAISKSGTIGRIGILKDYMCGNRAVINIKVNENICNPLFIFYTLLNSKEQIETLAEGSVQKNLYVSALSKVKLLLPDINKQKEIGYILNTLDQKIELNTQINQTLEQIAQALFKSWFVDFDPVRAKVQALSDGLSLEQAELAAMQTISGKTPEELTALLQTQPERYAELAETAKAFPYEIVEVDGVEVPKGWEVTPLSGLFALISGTQIPKEEHIYEAKEGYERFIQNRDYSSNNHITYVEISKKNKRCTEKDILIDRYGDAGKIRFGISGVYNIALAKIVLNDNNLTEYLRWFLMQPKQKAYFEQASGASTRASLNTSTFKGINVVIPSNFILNIFSKISNTYLDSLRNLKEENNTLMKTRDSLLPKLLKQDV
ncbi:restriction endonuclease subunit S [Haemophilus haemolyticus]|uniref:restriction endonuclease subunit S n=1 Tax=Haemophilus haemolyticus TaxID=726 RepID=UPI00025E6438|nr:restriction endonuclease subunit S [Haemophilus haemolyticus]EIJ74340.1 type I restriction modification DNA specificity domain protein [Haemophilus haemolyticus HK386]OBX39338.1 hypothetical protein A8M50_04000 [Haemophilus haemolyticus]